MDFDDESDSSVEDPVLPVEPKLPDELPRIDVPDEPAVEEPPPVEPDEDAPIEEPEDPVPEPPPDDEPDDPLEDPKPEEPPVQDPDDDPPVVESARLLRQSLNSSENLR